MQGFGGFGFGFGFGADRRENEFGPWLHPPLTEVPSESDSAPQTQSQSPRQDLDQDHAAATVVQISSALSYEHQQVQQHNASSHRFAVPSFNPRPAGFYGIVDSNTMNQYRPLVQFLTNTDTPITNQPPANILFIRMTNAQRTVKHETQESIAENKVAPESSAFASVSTSSTNTIGVTNHNIPESQFNWTSHLSDSGWHWLWFKYGPALAELLNTNLNCDLPIWMTPQFDEGSLSQGYGAQYSGPVLFKRKPTVEQEKVALEAKADASSKPANFQLSAHPHSLMLYASRYHGTFRCKLCKSNREGQCYACNVCGWDCCTKCFTENDGYDPNPKPLPNPCQEKQLTSDDFLYTAHALLMKPSYEFQLFEQGNTANVSGASLTSDTNLLSFHQVLRWLHQQLGSNSDSLISNFDLQVALKASLDMEEGSQLLCRGIQALLELQYLTRLFPEVWCALHPAVLSKSHKSNSNYAWNLDELSGIIPGVNGFICAMDPTIGLKQIDLNMVQFGVESIQSLLTQLNSEICTRFPSRALHFLRRSHLLETLKQAPSDKNIVGWHLKSRDEQNEAQLQQEQQLVRFHLATLPDAVQAAQLPFSILAVCPDPDPSIRESNRTMGSSKSLWSEYGDGAEYRFNDSSGFFVPSNVNPLEALPKELILEADKWTNRGSGLVESGEEPNAIRIPTPEQISESLSNSNWLPMCGGDREMKHYNPDYCWKAPNQRHGSGGRQMGFFGGPSGHKSVPLHKMSLAQPRSDEQSTFLCNLCGRSCRGSRYQCLEHGNDICLDCGRENRITWLQSIVNGFNAHRVRCENRMLCIQSAAASLNESDSVSVIRAVLERGDHAVTSSASSTAISAQSFKLWFDDFEFDRLLSAFWNKSPSLQSIQPLDTFKMKLSGASRENAAKLIDFFHLSNAFKLAFSNYPAMVDSIFQKLISESAGQQFGLTDLDIDAKNGNAPEQLYSLHEEIRRSTEIPSLSSISINRMNSVNQLASSVLRSLHSRIHLSHLGWISVEETAQVHSEILDPFNKPIVFGLLGYQRNGFSASTIIQQLVPCLARLFDKYYAEEAKAGRNVNEDNRIQFRLVNERCNLPNDLWRELYKSPPPGGVHQGLLLFLPPTNSRELRVATRPTVQPYDSVTFGNDRYANPDDPQEGRELTLEPVIRSMDQVFRSSTGSSVFDMDTLLRLSAPIQAQSEMFERCVRIVESVAKMELHNPRLNKQLSIEVGPTMPVDNEEYSKLHGRFIAGLAEFGQVMEEFEVDSMKAQLIPFEQFTRLHSKLRHEQSEKKKERLAKRKQNLEYGGAKSSSAKAAQLALLPTSVLSFTPTPLQTQQVFSILSSLDAAVASHDFGPFDDATRIPSGGRMSIFRWKKQKQKQKADTLGTCHETYVQNQDTSASSSSAVDISSDSVSATSEVPFDYHWLILIERVLYSPAGGYMITDVSHCGSEGASVKVPSSEWSLDFLGTSIRSLCEESGEINPNCHELQLQGQTVELHMDDPGWFEERGVELEDEPTVTPVEFCRACVGDPLIRPLLFCSNSKLQSFCADSDPSLLPLIQLDDWNHPSGFCSTDWERENNQEQNKKQDSCIQEESPSNKFDTAESDKADEPSSNPSSSTDFAIPPLTLRPSRSKTYQLIAELLVGRAGDDAQVAAALWERKKMDLEPGNTHWKYWPEAGAF